MYPRTGLRRVRVDLDQLSLGWKRITVWFMPGNEVYSWRVDTALKEALERAARADNTSVANLLRTIVTDWLASNPAPGEDADSQLRMRNQALRCAGTILGGDPDRAEQASSRVRAALQARRAD